MSAKKLLLNVPIEEFCQYQSIAKENKISLSELFRKAARERYLKAHKHQKKQRAFEKLLSLTSDSILPDMKTLKKEDILSRYEK